MIEAKEHYYDDDPGAGPADVRTRLRDACYFFLGNGLIQAAVQLAPSGEGTPLGLLIMDPERLGKKREALTMDPVSGLAGTLLEVETAEGRRFEAEPPCLRVEWADRSGLPTVRALWKAGSLEVEESFFCPHPDEPRLIREVVLRGASGDKALVRARICGEGATASAAPRADGSAAAYFAYDLDASRRSVLLTRLVEPPEESQARAYWSALSDVSFGDSRLDRFFRAARHQLPAVVSAAGTVDGGIWQYNREWVRDQSVMAAALAMLGETRRSRTMFVRLLDRFVTPEGDTVDSSERRGPDEVELDQNGYLLLYLNQYALWTGDLGIVREFWERIRAAAEFPLRPVFRHEPSGLLMNRREYWERHRIHGIETGFELIYQAAVAAGLQAGASLARLVGREQEAARWAGESERLRRALLEDRIYRLVDNRGFIKRRAPDGRAQETIAPVPEAGLPAGVPLAGPGLHYLNPDTSAALPIVFGLVPPDSPIATLTMSSLEGLWNQGWTGGGYGRYHISSEPDSPGPWPFASLFVARAAVETGEFAVTRRVLDWMDSVPGAAAGSWFEFYGPRMAPPFPQVGVIPWTWAEIVHLAVHHLLGVRPEEDGVTVRPRLWPGLGPVRADLALRGVRLRLDLDPAGKGGGCELESDGAVLERKPDRLKMAYPGADLRVRG